MGVSAVIEFEAVPVVSPPGSPLAVELLPPPDPWAVVCRLSHLPKLMFLDSSEKHPARGRYSYIAADSPQSFQHAPAQSREANRDRLGQALAQLADAKIHNVPGLPPFQGGLAGFVGYDFGRSLEVLHQTRHDEFQTPEWSLAAYDWVISFDHLANRAWIVASGKQESAEKGVNLARAQSRLAKLLKTLRDATGVSRPTQQLPVSSLPNLQARELAAQYALPGYPHVTSNFDRDRYEHAVRKAIDYIHAGDCFQVNLSQRLLSAQREDPLDLYGRLRLHNAAPFAGYFDAGHFQILSASPERFLRVSDSEVVTRPIKGTRPRGSTAVEDAVRIQDLLSNPKDRAENVMIVDLLRNDLGKVCEYGSVRVTKVCELESFPYVHHLVSEVKGRLRAGVGPRELLAATFPGGSVSGAPKVRAMEIIAELEPTARGPYCGCLGWFGYDGSVDTNILIRTFIVGRGWVQFPVGGGIVADSEPGREYEETLHKAAGLLKALTSRGVES
jgi:para-aminobenzoate synthetase component 1